VYLAVSYSGFAPLLLREVEIDLNLLWLVQYAQALLFLGVEIHRWEIASPSI
jgi:hypothetical protein